MAEQNANPNPNPANAGGAPADPNPAPAGGANGGAPANPAPTQRAIKLLSNAKDYTILYRYVQAINDIITHGEVSSRIERTPAGNNIYNGVGQSMSMGRINSIIMQHLDDYGLPNNISEDELRRLYFYGKSISKTDSPVPDVDAITEAREAYDAGQQEALNASEEAREKHATSYAERQKEYGKARRGTFGWLMATIGSASLVPASIGACVAGLIMVATVPALGAFSWMSGAGVAAFALGLGALTLARKGISKLIGFCSGKFKAAREKKKALGKELASEKQQYKQAQRNLEANQNQYRIDRMFDNNDMYRYPEHLRAYNRAPIDLDFDSQMIPVRHVSPVRTVEDPEQETGDPQNGIFGNRYTPEELEKFKQRYNNLNSQRTPEQEEEPEETPTEPEVKEPEEEEEHIYVPPVVGDETTSGHYYDDPNDYTHVVFKDPEHGEDEEPEETPTEPVVEEPEETPAEPEVEEPEESPAKAENDAEYNGDKYGCAYGHLFDRPDFEHFVLNNTSSQFKEQVINALKGVRSEEDYNSVVSFVEEHMNRFMAKHSAPKEKEEPKKVEEEPEVKEPEEKPAKEEPIKEEPKVEEPAKKEPKTLEELEEAVKASDKAIEELEADLARVKAEKTKRFVSDEYYGYNEKTTKFVARQADLEIKDKGLSGEEAALKAEEIRQYNESYDTLDREQHDIQDYLRDEAGKRKELEEKIEELKNKKQSAGTVNTNPNETGSDAEDDTGSEQAPADNEKTEEQQTDDQNKTPAEPVTVETTEKLLIDFKVFDDSLVRNNVDPNNTAMIHRIFERHCGLNSISPDRAEELWNEYAKHLQSVKKSLQQAIEAKKESGDEPENE